MLVVLVNWAWTIKEFFVGSIEITLSAWLLYVVDPVGGDVAVQPMILLADHYDGVRDHRSTF